MFHYALISRYTLFTGVLVSSLLLSNLSYGTNLSYSKATTVADLFDQVIAPHVQQGFVNYDDINHKQLKDLVTRIDQTQIDKQSRNENLAFYLNAYNALAVKGIVDGYGPHSLLSRYRFFKANKYRVAGKVMSLHELEHNVIRPLKEARIHFALVCAATACPPLRNEAYRAKNLDKQLNDQATIFLNNSEKNSFDLNQKQAELSAIFKWFKEDFLEEADSLSEFVAPFINDSNTQQALEKNQLSVRFKKYDWSLNGKR